MKRLWLSERTMFDADGNKVSYLSKIKKAKEMRISTRTIDRMVLNGKLPFVIFGPSPRKWFLKGGTYEKDR